MRSVWGLAGLLVFTACDRTGIEIVVYPPADPSVTVDEVRLYLGVGDGTDGLITPNRPGPRRMNTDGTYWSRDVSNELDVQAMSPGSGTPARFVYPGDEGLVVTAIAVGYLDGVPNSSIAKFDLTVPSERFAVYTIGLNPARDPVESPFAINQVQLWGPQSAIGADDQSCVRAENYRGDTDDNYHRVAYIVSAGDPDCDGYASGSPEECQETVFHGKQVAAQDTLDCLINDTLGTSTVEACIIGAGVCEDGKPEARVDCSKSLPFCAPRSLCHECDTDFGCAIEPLKHNIDQQAHMACKLRYTELPDGRIQVCQGSLLRVAPPLLLPVGDVCTGTPMFRGSGSGNADGTGLDHWANKWVQGASSISFQDADLSCGFTIALQGEVAASAFPVAGLASVRIASSRGDHGVIVPIKIELEPGGCELPQPVLCTPTNYPADTLDTCLQSIVPGP